MRGGGGRGKRALATTFLACGPILQAALDAACFPLAQQPLALAVVDPIHGHAAVVAAVPCRRTSRFPHGLVAAGPVAKNLRMSFCCVTTRGLCVGGRRHFGTFRHAGLVRLPFASLPFRLGMLPAPFRGGSAFPLPLGRLPTVQALQTFGFLAVVLVVPPRLESAAALFVEARAPSQSTAPGVRIAFVGMLNLSHGR